ncbi:MAG: hypothetical protein DRI61_08495 [Chloroflexi bacterium]|nr:MAG: hypothetical protein DRI61_08495 [Chloroflexota bacterium]
MWKERVVAKRIHLFVSSSRDLAAEREAVGQAVAELPISKGWEIRHTAHRGEPISATLEAIEKCDLFLIILGQDATAPIGLEWEHARLTGKRILAYRKDVTYSPSAQYFLRASKAEWVLFKDAEALKRDLLKTLAQELLDVKNRYGLIVEDVEKLMEFLKHLEEEEGKPIGEAEGAGESGVIIGQRG